MKSTGIIRRIDNLGRIVIPKEIRNTLKIRDGESLEIYVSNGEEIVLKKYSLVSNLKEIAENYVDSVYNLIRYNIFITDRDTIIAAAGSLKKDYIDQSLSSYLIDVMERRETIVEKFSHEFAMTETQSESEPHIIVPIVANGDVVGSILMLCPEGKLTELEEKIMKVAGIFLGKYIEQ